jgi:diguanylate cyclase (GGDEF)-like protein
MPFKYRLHVFFLILTILPLLLAGWIIQGVSGRNQENQVDSRLITTLAGASRTYTSVVDGARQGLILLAQRPDLQRALLDKDKQALAATLGRFNVADLSVEAVDPKGNVLAGSLPPVAGENLSVTIPKRGTLKGRIPFAKLARTSSQAAGKNQKVFIWADGKLYGPNGEVSSAAAPPVDHAVHAKVFGEGVRATATQISADPARARIVATYPQSKLDSRIASLRWRVVGVIAVAILVIALLSALLVRSLTATLRIFASRARAVAQGDFDQQLPDKGRDEFAQFGRAFNEMSRELARRIEELETERRRVEDATARFGTALASSHDVAALLEIVLSSSMQLARAKGGRLLVADEGSSLLVEQLRLGDTQDAAAVLDAPLRLGEGVEGRALQSLVPQIASEPVAALCAPLLTERTVLGLITLVGPESGEFDREAPRAVGALASQGAVAIENARLHRLIQKQARTDGLTGLSNHREFQEQLGHEVERAQRFGVSVGLIFLDLDDFKLINDRYGHLAGDSVLKHVAQVIKSCIRDIDHAARYGGEEFAVILPHTSLDGAIRLGERIRQAIAERAIPLPEGGELHVTSSLGVAAVPATATSQIEAIAVADAALYRAKQQGKNRLVAGVASDSTTAA